MCAQPVIPAVVLLWPRARSPSLSILKQAIEEYLSVTVRREDVQSVWSGIRPLAADPNAANTADAVRDHLVTCEGDGMVTVTGGKWTTYRLMAQDAIDLAARVGGLAAGPCRTRDLRLVGANGFHPALFAEVRAGGEWAGGEEG